MPELRPDWIEELLQGDRRQRFLQDGPIMADVWTEFASNPQGRVDLLLTPFWGCSPGEVARCLLWYRARGQEPQQDPECQLWASQAKLAVNQSVVAVTVTFDELLRYVLPLTGWWAQTLTRLRRSTPEAGISREHSALSLSQIEQMTSERERPVSERQTLVAFLNLVGAFLRVQESLSNSPSTSQRARQGSATRIARASDPAHSARQSDATADRRYRHKDNPNLERGRRWLASVTEESVPLPASIAGRLEPDEGVLFQVSLNRKGRGAIYRSRQTVKADAVDNLFRVSCGKITWAILDTGIDAGHEVFRRRSTADDRADGAAVKENGRFKHAFEKLEGIPWNRTRVRYTFDFTRIRELLTVQPLPDPQDPTRASPGPAFSGLPEAVRRRLEARDDGQGLAFQAAELRQALLSGREVDWTLIRPLVEILPDEYEAYLQDSPLLDGHGTHVAGILGADGDGPRSVQGICPDIELYDFRVLSDGSETDEFAVMCALQFVRYLNSHHDRRVVHGINLSFSFHHDVRLFACGRTPICEECERLVGTGVVVVAAAGNEGWEAVRGRRSNQYRPASITDPGNAEAVITVGATHRSEPHTYGISFFSSRGPTGDGRSKPDLVAPGEKIESALPENGRGFRDGTSQAAPHVCGAAALLMARHPELIGQPARIKRILCETATDLGRERHYQGAGLVDILRALQSL